MDKYEEFARTYRKKGAIFVWKHQHDSDPLSCDEISEEIANAVRVFDAERAKETCECLADDVKGKGYSHCHYCGKLISNGLRIKEGE